MSHSKHKTQSWVVHRQFEPGRLSPEWLADAYEKVIPKCVRVIEITADDARVRIRLVGSE